MSNDEMEGTDRERQEVIASLDVRAGVPKIEISSNELHQWYARVLWPDGVVEVVADGADLLQAAAALLVYLVKKPL